MDRITSLDKFKCPYGGQEIELQQVDYATGGMSLLRIRIREGKRFTIFEIDPLTAEKWGQGLLDWSHRQATKSDEP